MCSVEVGQTLEELVEMVPSKPPLAPESAVERVCRLLARKDYCFLPAHQTGALLSSVQADAFADWPAFHASWDDLPVDQYMADGGQYRKRRHTMLSAQPSSRRFSVQPHQPHFQSLNYNSLTGGLVRHFEPMAPAILAGATFNAFVTLGCEIFGRLSPYSPWHIEAHQFRIESQGGQIGKPTPEGMHRDGVSFVMMAVIRRTNMRDGATTVYDTERVLLDEFTLQQPLDMAIVNDERTFHNVTPIVQLDSDQPAVRDALVLTFRHKD